MAAIVTDADIARPPAQVFAYVTDPSRFGEWQAGVVSGFNEGGDATVGGRCVMTRRLGGTTRTFVSEITEADRPRRWAVRGINGPVRATVGVTVEPRQDGRESHVTISMEFTGHGLGRMLLPMVVRQARTEVPRSCQKLKRRLEQQSG
jgi:uncharacterized protein YndB with AHSA1/START domain